MRRIDEGFLPIQTINMATIKTAKQECLNPNSGNKLNIDKSIYDLFAASIRHALSDNKQLTYTELAASVQEYITQKKIVFDRSIGWYTVTVKNDLEARGIIHIVHKNGKKLNML